MPVKIQMKPRPTWAHDTRYYCLFKGLPCEFLKIGTYLDPGTWEDYYSFSCIKNQLPIQIAESGILDTNDVLKDLKGKDLMFTFCPLKTKR